MEKVKGVRKLRYLVFCTKCKKETWQRYLGGSLFEDRYECVKCKTKNTEHD